MTEFVPTRIPPRTEAEAIERIRAAKTTEELFHAVVEGTAFDPDDDYDILKALEENRRRSGDARMPSPIDGDGATQ